MHFLQQRSASYFSDAPPCIHTQNMIRSLGSRHSLNFTHSLKQDDMVEMTEQIVY